MSLAHPTGPSGTARAAAARFATELSGKTRVGLGCMGLTGIYGAVARTDALEALHAALDGGITLFDTAALYASGANEELLGEALGHRRDVTLVTKFGLREAADGSLLRDSSSPSIRASVEASLRRLRRDRLDLLLQHRPDPAVPDHAVAETVAGLIAEGKVAAFGLSGTGTDRVLAWRSDPAVQAVQNELSLSAPGRLAEPSLVMARGAVFMAYAPLGRGLLTGSRPGGHGDLRRGMPSFRDAGPSRAADPVKVLTLLASLRGTSASAIALAWLLAKAPNVVAIPGCRSRAQVAQIAGAGSLALDREELAQLDGATRPAEV